MTPGDVGFRNPGHTGRQPGWLQYTATLGQRLGYPGGAGNELRAARPLPQPQQRASEAPGQLHVHVHGVTAEDVAAIIRQQIR